MLLIVWSWAGPLPETSLFSLGKEHLTALQTCCVSRLTCICFFTSSMALSCIKGMGYTMSTQLSTRAAQPSKFKGTHLNLCIVLVAQLHVIDAFQDCALQNVPHIPPKSYSLNHGRSIHCMKHPCPCQTSSCH